jgi:glycosyltransferase involved in cell wall biosynthesis
MTRRASLVVTLSPALASVQPESAGSRYLRDVGNVLDEAGHRVVAVVPDGMSVQRSLAQGGNPEHVVVPASPQSTLRSTMRRIAVPAGAWPGWTRVLRRNPQVRALIGSADVLDLQWEEQSALIPALRSLNPRALIVCTLHDVLSQRFSRAAASAGSSRARIRWKWAAWRARAAERLLMRHADHVVVLSSKDAELLPAGRARVHVVTPALSSHEAPRTTRERGPDVLLVSMLARWENEEGLSWFMAEVWPSVRERIPAARLRVAGLGIRPHIAEAASRAGVELMGFVEDLEPLYDAASAVVVPLRLGAGVKFKVIDALVRGVPVVTTSVGAEGIGGAGLFAGLTDDAAEFANRLCDVLVNAQPYEDRAASARAWARDRYGTEQFRASITAAYGVGE